MPGPASPDVRGFHESVTSGPRKIEQVTRLEPFQFRGRTVDIQRVAIAQGKLEANRSPIPQRTNVVYSAYNLDNPLVVYGNVSGELQEGKQGKSLSITWAQRQHPTRGVVREMLRELVERGEVQEINTRGEQLTPDLQQTAEILELQSRDPNSGFRIDISRQQVNGKEVITGFAMHPKNPALG